MKDVIDTEETFEQTEKRLVESERVWLDAIRLRNTAGLKQLLASDFTHATGQTTGGPIGKKDYLASALKDGPIVSHAFDNLSVRVYSNTAVVNGSYSPRGASGAAPGASYIFTDVWVKLDGR